MKASASHVDATTGNTQNKFLTVKLPANIVGNAFQDTVMEVRNDELSVFLSNFWCISGGEPSKRAARRGIRCGHSIEGHLRKPWANESDEKAIHHLFELQFMYPSASRSYCHQASS